MRNTVWQILVTWENGITTMHSLEACRESSSGHWAEQLRYIPQQTERWWGCSEGKLWAGTTSDPNPLPCPSGGRAFPVMGLCFWGCVPLQPTDQRLCTSLTIGDPYGFRKTSENESGNGGWNQNNFRRGQCPFLRKTNNSIHKNKYIQAFFCQYSKMLIILKLSTANRWWVYRVFFFNIFF